MIFEVVFLWDLASWVQQTHTHTHPRAHADTRTGTHAQAEARAQAHARVRAHTAHHPLNATHCTLCCVLLRQGIVGVLVRGLESWHLRMGQNTTTPATCLCCDLLMLHLQRSPCHCFWNRNDLAKQYKITKATRCLVIVWQMHADAVCDLCRQITLSLQNLLTEWVQLDTRTTFPWHLEEQTFTPAVDVGDPRLAARNL